MIQPMVVLCRGGGVPSMLRLGGSYADDGVQYNLLARTRPFFPAGVGGECIFTNLYVTLTGYDVAMGLGVLFYIDGVPFSPAPNARLIGYQKYIFAGGSANPRGVQTVHELSLLQPFPVYPAVEQSRYAPRGSSISVEFGTEFGGGGSPNRIVVDGVEAEYEIVREIRGSPFVANS